MPLVKCKGEAYLVVKDKNEKTMIRKVEVFPLFDDSIIGLDNAQARKDQVRVLLGNAILQYCANGIDPLNLSYMGVAAVYISEMDSDVANLAAYISGYDSALDPVSVLPNNYVVDYAMYRRAKYIGNNPSVGNKMVYYKTPENVEVGDPIENAELPAAFPILFTFGNLVNGGVLGQSKLYTDWRYRYSLESIELSDHIQAKSGKV